LKKLKEKQNDDKEKRGVVNRSMRVKKKGGHSEDNGFRMHVLMTVMFSLSTVNMKCQEQPYTHTPTHHKEGWRKNVALFKKKNGNGARFLLWQE
jgi:hypothetical protein